MISLVCPDCQSPLKHNLGDDETACKCGFVLKMGHRIDAKNTEALKKLENGFYWFCDAGNEAEPVELRQDGENSLIYFIGSVLASCVPFEINDGSFLFTPRLAHNNRLAQDAGRSVWIDSQ